MNCSTVEFDKNDSPAEQSTAALASVDFAAAVVAAVVAAAVAAERVAIKFVDFVPEPLAAIGSEAAALLSLLCPKKERHNKIIH